MYIELIIFFSGTKSFKRFLFFMTLLIMLKQLSHETETYKSKKLLKFNIVKDLLKVFSSPVIPYHINFPG